MKEHYQVLAAWTASVVAFALTGASNVPNLPMPANSAMIFNAGSGDFAGFRIVVEPAGNAVAIDGAGHTANELQPDIVQKFFSDLAAAAPLSQLPAGECSTAKPGTSSTTVEVNSAIVVTWNDQRSPALSCVSDPRAQKILLDATTIQRALYVAAYRKRTTLAYGANYHGTRYQVGGYGAAGYGGGGGSYSDRFKIDGFYYDNFNTGQFSMPRFDDSGRPNVSSPWSAGPGTSPNFTTLPYALPWGGAPTTTLPTVNPYFNGSWSSLPTVNPYSNGPTGTPPYSASP